MLIRFYLFASLVALVLMGCGDGGGKTKRVEADAGPVSEEITLFGKGELPAPTRLNSIFGTWEIVFEEEAYPDRVYKDNEDPEPAKFQVGRSTIRIQFSESRMIYSKKCTVSVEQPVSGTQEGVSEQGREDEKANLLREYTRYAEVILPISIEERQRKLTIGKNAKAKSVQLNEEGPIFACVLDFSNNQVEQLHYLVEAGELFLPGPAPEPELEPGEANEESEADGEGDNGPDEGNDEIVEDEPFDFPEAFYKISDQSE